MQTLAAFATWLIERGHRVLLFPTQMKADPPVIKDTVALVKEYLPTFHGDGHRQNAQPAWSVQADDLLQRHEMRQMIRDKVNLLPDDYRTVIMLRDIEQMDTEATAEALGITAGAVKT